MPEWTEPRTWVPGERLRAPQLNAQLRDNLLVLVGLVAVKAEVTSAGQRSSDTYGPLDDESGPEVAFRTGPSGDVTLAIYAHARTTEEGEAQRAYMSYEIERVSDNEVVVAPSDFRSVLWRKTLGESGSLTWLEGSDDGLDPDTEYVARLVYRHEGDGEIDASYRRIVVWGVREVTT